jgi:CBS domain-containing membrane protein
MAFLLNNALRRPYPHPQQPLHSNQHGSKDQPPSERTGISQADLDAVFQRYGQVVDISRDDFESLLQQTEMRAYRRRFGDVTCADIMTRDVMFAEFGTPLQEAWMMMRTHNIWALPVVTASRRVIGLIGRENFMHDSMFDDVGGIANHLKNFLKPSVTVHSERPEVVGQIMRQKPMTLEAGRPFIELVPHMTDTNQRHIPIVDENHNLMGIVTQSDLIAALYNQGITSALHLEQAAQPV